MKEGDSTSLLERYSKLREDSLYREDTYEFTNRLPFRTCYCCTKFLMLSQVKAFYPFCCSSYIMRFSIHYIKRLSIFPSPAGMSLTKLSLARNNLIISGHKAAVALCCIN
jgi:hypothetical protein